MTNRAKDQHERPSFNPYRRSRAANKRNTHPRDRDKEKEDNRRAEGEVADE